MPNNEPRDVWERWRRQPSADAAKLSYQEPVARLEAGGAAVQLSVTVPSDKPRWPCPGA